MIDHGAIVRAYHLLFGAARWIGMIQANANHQGAK
jgi:hypothetical protein